MFSVDHYRNVLIIIFATWVTRKVAISIINRGVRNSIRSQNYRNEREEKKREDTVGGVINTVIKLSSWVIGFMLILSEIGVDIGPLLAGVSFVGIAVGFGAQSLVKDFFAGLFIVLENQYRVGDVVTIAGVSGRVESVSFRNTVLRDLDGDKHFIPNGSVDVATNKTMDFSSININVGVSYDSDIAVVEKIINEVGIALVRDENIGPNIIKAPYFSRVREFGAYDVSVKVLGRVQPGKQWSVAGEFRKRLKLAFEKEGIEIPYPQTVIHQGDPKPSPKKKPKKKK